MRQLLQYCNQKSEPTLAKNPGPPVLEKKNSANWQMLSGLKSWPAEDTEPKSTAKEDTLVLWANCDKQLCLKSSWFMRPVLHTLHRAQDIADLLSPARVHQMPCFAGRQNRSHAHSCTDLKHIHRERERERGIYPTAWPWRKNEESARERRERERQRGREKTQSIDSSRYPEYEPDIDSFLELLEPFFRVTEEEDSTCV